MSDSRLDSCHLQLYRRTQYQEARQAILDARGWETGCLEQWCGMINAVEWSLVLPFRPDALLPATKFLLIDAETDQIHPLETGINALGRYPNNDIVFTDSGISRRHCVMLVHTDGRCELHDTASMNGTFVNGVRIQNPVSLNTGDMVQLCRRVLYFFDEYDFRKLVDVQDRARGREPSDSMTAVF
jgi:hypothetical protein